jgi:hypothetical protein
LLRCCVPAGVDGADVVQRIGVNERVAVDGEDVPRQ